jgi:hypothetical protein
MHFLSSSPELFPACVDRCYDPDPAVATGYFQVGVAVQVHECGRGCRHGCIGVDV